MSMPGSISKWRDVSAPSNPNEGVLMRSHSTLVGKLRLLLVVQAGLVLMQGCSGSSGDSGSSAGGNAGASSANQTGGNPASVGGNTANVSGASTGTGGTKANGQTTTGGNTTATGGATSATGGASTTGATTGTGGSTKSTGGTTATGGTAAVTGGTTAKGGSTTTGTTTPGGTKATGGTQSNGGTTTTGGTKATGGTAATGGAQSTGGSSAGGATSVGSPILEPDSGALLGLYYGDASIAATTTKLGRALPLHLTYYAWNDDWTQGATKSDLSAGRIPFVNWELYDGNLDEIIAGTDDSMVSQRASDAKKLGGKLFLDFGAEMNGDWSPWSGALNGQSSAKYLAAYRHVHDLFVAAGATNVIWAFCPNVTDEPRETWNQALNYYPGDDYVDWTCVDGYNWGTAGDGWQTFLEVFRDIYPKLASKNKPIIIGEMASAEGGGDKAAWIAQIIPALKSNFPMIKGLVWFDVNKETDWRISSSTASEAAFKTMANDPYFAH
jgi:hypothetical protein